jgi:hypothetical protein
MPAPGLPLPRLPACPLVRFALPKLAILRIKPSRALAVIPPVTLPRGTGDGARATHRGKRKKQTPTPGAAPGLRPPRRRSGKNTG